MATPHDGLRFGVFELDLESGELRKSGLKLKLQEQPLQVLAALLERPGDVVSREELQRKLWPDGTFVEFDHSLSTAVNRLRETLGDSAKSPRYVETVARRGYRFLGPVETLDGQRQPEPVVPRERSGTWRWFLTAAVLGSMAVAAVVWLTRADSPPNYEFKQLTWDTGLTTDPAISPDGKLVAYASDRAGGDNLDIWVQQVSGGKPVQLTSHEANDRCPSFSSDGTRIVFASERDGGGIYVVPVIGGHETLLSKVTALYQQPRFSPNDRWVAFHAGYQTELRIVPATGGQPQIVETGLAYASRPVWSPDGKHLLFLGRDSSDPEFDWWVAPVEGGVAVRTGVYDVLRKEGFELKTFTAIMSSLYSVWDPGGQRIVFNGSIAGSKNIWSIPISQRSWKVSGDLQRLTDGTGELQPSLAADGRMVFSSRRTNHDIWALPIDANRGAVNGALKRVTTGLADDWYPTVSADGRKMVFVSKRSGNFDVWLRNLETGEEIPLTATAEEERRAAISPDGSQVAYVRKSAPGSGNDIHLLSVDAGTSEKIATGNILTWSSVGAKLVFYDPRPPLVISTLDVETRKILETLSHPKYETIRPRCSPDDRWIAFQLGEPNGYPSYVAPMRDGVAAPQSEWVRIYDRGYLPWWSPDGNLLYAVSDQDGYECIFARRLDPATKQPMGKPFDILHIHHSRLDVPVNFGYGMTNDMLYMSLRETTGNIWLAEPVE